MTTVQKTNEIALCDMNLITSIANCGRMNLIEMDERLNAHDIDMGGWLDVDALRKNNE